MPGPAMPRPHPATSLRNPAKPASIRGAPGAASRASHGGDHGLRRSAAAARHPRPRQDAARGAAPQHLRARGLAQGRAVHPHRSRRALWRQLLAQGRRLPARGRRRPRPADILHAARRRLRARLQGVDGLSSAGRHQPAGDLRLGVVPARARGAGAGDHRRLPAGAQAGPRPRRRLGRRCRSDLRRRAFGGAPSWRRR